VSGPHAAASWPLDLQEAAGRARQRLALVRGGRLAGTRRAALAELTAELCQQVLALRHEVGMLEAGLAELRGQVGHVHWHLDGDDAPL
jgi:hypothetical protein